VLGKGETKAAAGLGVANSILDNSAAIAKEWEVDLHGVSTSAEYSYMTGKVWESIALRGEESRMEMLGLWNQVITTAKRIDGDALLTWIQGCVNAGLPALYEKWKVMPVDGVRYIVDDNDAIAYGNLEDGPRATLRRLGQAKLPDVFSGGD
jgi:hypothetical protein